MFENPRRGRQARNFTTNVPKILDLKSSSKQIFFRNCRWVPLKTAKSTTDSAVLRRITWLMVVPRNLAEAGFGRCYLVSTHHEILSNIDRNQVLVTEAKRRRLILISMYFIDMLSCLKSKIEICSNKACT